MGQWPKLQLIGPIALFCAILAAEAAVCALGQSPSSEVLWYINVGLFVAFQKSHYILSSYVNFPYFQLFGIALPVLVLALVGVAAKKQLLLAISSNLSFVYAFFLVYCWFYVVGASRTASMVAIVTPDRLDLYVYLLMLGSSLISFFISHIVYLGGMRARS